MKSAARAAPSVRMRGEVLSLRAPAPGFCLATLLEAQGDGKTVAIVGALLGCQPGDTVEIGGHWQAHERYGMQLRVTECVVVSPADASGAIAWIASRLPGVGRARATEMVRVFGVPRVWDVLEDGRDLVSVAGIGADRAVKISEAYSAIRGERDRMVRLRGWGLTDNQAAKVIAEWGDATEATLQRDPYKLAECVPGFGFKRADQIALRMGLPPLSPSRINAAIAHVMSDARQAGHVYVPAGKLAGLVLGADALDVRKDADAVGAVWRELDAQVKSGALVREEDGRVYARAQWDAEVGVARFFARKVA